jgi:hypothetical protein
MSAGASVDIACVHPHPHLNPSTRWPTRRRNCSLSFRSGPDCRDHRREGKEEAVALLEHFVGAVWEHRAPHQLVMLIVQFPISVTAEFSE